MADERFDYGIIEDDVAKKLEFFSTAGHALIRKSHIRFIADFGEILSGARDLLSHHGNGTFIKWATSEFDLTKQTIYNYVNAWDKCLSNGWTNFSGVTPTALYLLSNDDVPKPVRAKALTLSKKQSVTKADVEKLLAKSLPQVTETVTQVTETPTSEAIPVVEGEDGRTDSDGTEAAETSSRPPRSGTEKPAVELGKCPNCAGGRWDEDEDGYSCAKCKHPHGEPAGDVDEKRFKEQRAKTVKTVEALMRAFDDLEMISSCTSHGEAISGCKELLSIAKAWS